MKIRTFLAKITLVLAAAAGIVANARAASSAPNRVEHVLLISVDGLHALDLDNFAAANPNSTLAQLAGTGLVFPNCSCSKPSDSFPGLMAMITGGSPAATGVYYDDSYDRTLLPPLAAGGGSAPGTEVQYAENLDLDPSRLDAGGGIDPNQLPRDPATGQPVYPHQFLRVNTIFEVVKAAGLRTAWCDKHPAYDIVHGPSGQGCDDLFTPEINSRAPHGTGFDNTASEEACQDYDRRKVNAVLNEIKGLDHTGSRSAAVPALLGMNFQAVSVAQKLRNNVTRTGAAPDPSLVRGGYLDAVGTPSPLLTSALAFVDLSLGRMVQALKNNGLYERTLIIVSAKHGQGPIDPARLSIGNGNGDLIDNALAKAGVTVAQNTSDDVALLWLKDRTQGSAAFAALTGANESALLIQDVLFGPTLRLMFPDPAVDARVPDLIVLPTPGVIYSNSGKKIAEHGGFSLQDTNVALLVASPGMTARRVQSPVETAQIAPTIATALGLDPNALQAVQIEGTAVLPGWR